MVNSNKIYNMLDSNLKKIKSKNKLIKMGGSMTVKSKKFIKNLFTKKLIDRIETRNVELKLTNNTVKNLENIVPLILSLKLIGLNIKIKN